MKTLVAILATILLVISGIAQAGVSIQLYASPAPNAYGSPSWSGYVTNALNALESGNTSAGDPATNPTAFYTINQFAPTDIAVTGFQSWKGTVNPTTPFNAELGQRLHFPWVISSDTGLNDIKLSNVGNMDIYYNQGGTEYATFGDAATYRFSAYSGTRIGIKADGTIITSGTADQFVNKIIYVGYGQAFDCYHDSTGVLTDQLVLNNLMADLSNVESFRATVNYYDDSGASVAGADLTLVPEPVTMVLLGLGGLLFARKRK